LGKTAGIVLVLLLIASAIGMHSFSTGEPNQANTSLEVSQSTTNMHPTGWRWPGGPQRNETTVRITHTGGDRLDVTRTVIKVNGDNAVWGAPEPLTTDHPQPVAVPVPDIRPAIGTNNRPSYSEGKTWHILTYHGWPRHKIKNTTYFYDLSQSNETDGDPLIISYRDESGNFHRKGGSVVLEDGDTVTIHWRARSGNETRTLKTYPVA
jgi:hypothetical protein